MHYLECVDTHARRVLSAVSPRHPHKQYLTEWIDQVDTAPNADIPPSLRDITMTAEEEAAFVGVMFHGPCPIMTIEAPTPFCTRVGSVGVEVRSECRCNVLHHAGALPPIPIGACRCFVSSAIPLRRVKKRGGLAVAVVDVGGAIVVDCRGKRRGFWCSGHGAGACRRWHRPSRCGGVHRSIKRGSLTEALSAPRHVRERGGGSSAPQRRGTRNRRSQTATRVQTRRRPCAYAIN